MSKKSDHETVWTFVKELNRIGRLPEGCDVEKALVRIMEKAEKFERLKELYLLMDKSLDEISASDYLVAQREADAICEESEADGEPSYIDVSIHKGDGDTQDDGTWWFNHPNGLDYTLAQAVSCIDFLGFIVEGIKCNTTPFPAPSDMKLRFKTKDCA